MKTNAESPAVEIARFNREIGKVLTEVRLAAALSVEATAALIGCSATQLLNYESGLAPFPLADILLIALVCEYDLQAILAQVVLKSDLLMLTIPDEHPEQNLREACISRFYQNQSPETSPQILFDSKSAPFTRSRSRQNRKTSR